MIGRYKRMEGLMDKELFNNYDINAFVIYREIKGLVLTDEQIDELVAAATDLYYTGDIPGLVAAGESIYALCDNEPELLKDPYKNYRAHILEYYQVWVGL